ncbi:MAG: hypothetical protein ACLQIS_07230 [Bryobacteraceae bacterium]
MFTLMAGLGSNFRVLAIGCPVAMTRAQGMMYGLAAIMDQEGVAQACLSFVTQPQEFEVAVRRFLSR